MTSILTGTRTTHGTLAGTQPGHDRASGRYPHLYARPHGRDVRTAEPDPSTPSDPSTDTEATT
jgi:hypothetical protein